EVVGRLGRLVPLRLLLQPLVRIEGMLLALELLLVGKLATSRGGAILCHDVDRVRSGPLSLATFLHAARCARRREPRCETFKVAPLLGRKIARHVTPPGTHRA